MTSFSLFLLASTSLAVFALTVNPVKNVVQCQISLFTWKNGIPPYNLSIHPADDPSARALVHLGKEKGTSCKWTVNLPVGVCAALKVRDSVGDIAQSDGFTVQLGSENSCLKSTGVTNTPTSASVATFGANSPDSGSVLRSSASVTAGDIINASQNTSSTGTGDATSPSTSAAQAQWYFTPVEILAMTGVAALVVALAL